MAPSPHVRRTMSEDRLQQIRTLLAEEPEDAFLRYAMALELRKRGQQQEAMDVLEALLREDPKHIACYHQLATMLAEAGRTAEAIHVCDVGSMQCLVTGDRKTRGELLALKEALEDDA